MPRTSLLALLSALVSVGACRATVPAASPAAPPSAPIQASGAPIVHDEHSHAEPNRVRVTDVALALEIDFDHKQVAGEVTLTLDRRDPTAPVVLDAQGLEILAAQSNTGAPLPFTLGPADPRFGSALTVTLPPRVNEIRIRYRTTDKSAALQWLAPEQTRDHTQPFLFTQGEAIFTRTWIPLQDSPSVRVRYQAAIKAPAQATVVMSAEQLGRGADGVWRFRMNEPIPPYLIALAAGDLAFVPISARAGVWAEPSLVKAAAAELGDVESMIQAAESLYGRYRWGRYDVLVLPPSFPFGGMENPRLTFATPTVLAGDKSLVSLIAHELAHSWSGNLVTNATWRDFWLNEGFTTYCEQRIMEKVFGPDRSALEKQLARADLEDEMRGLEPWQQVLHTVFHGQHPDDAFSGVPYQKGALFLRRLEELFGRERFDPFLRGYFDGHAFQSITTDEFVAWLQTRLFPLAPDKAAQVDLHHWLDDAGLPADAPRVTTEGLAKVDRERQRWLTGTQVRALETAGWVTQQWEHFIRGMPADLPTARMAELDGAFHFTASGNSEILCDWLVLAVKRGYRPADRRLTEFLLGVGRRKYLKPLYSELVKTEPGRAKALEIYAQARPRYHAVSTGTIDKIVGWKTQ